MPPLVGRLYTGDTQPVYYCADCPYGMIFRDKFTKGHRKKEAVALYAPSKKEAQNLIVESCRDDMRKTLVARGFANVVRAFREHPVNVRARAVGL